MFIDEYPPRKVKGFEFTSVPRWSTTMTAVASGSERRTQNWANPLHTYVAPKAIDCNELILDVHDMWMALRGPLHSFPLRDPLDFASTRVILANTPPSLSRVDQFIAIGDGSTTTFQLQKAYTYGSETYYREILRPVVSSVIIGINGDAPGDVGPGDGGPYTVVSVDRDGGTFTLSPAPNNGLVITAGYLFDVECRFEADDSYDQMVKTFGAAGVADLVFKEIRPCI